jgi:PucR C-terminal helix-turn-helix domain/GGDEF-like domain
MKTKPQMVVDALAARVARPILVEDHHQRVVAYSDHDDPGDRVRQEAILRRRSPPEAIAWWERCGLTAARTPVRMPGNPGLGLSPRVCVPIFHGGTLLGHVWLVDAGGTVTDAEIALVSDVAPELALALYSEKVLDEIAARRQTEAVHGLLLGDAAARGHAVGALVGGGYFDAREPVTAVVVEPRLRAGAADETLRLALEAVLSRAGRRLAPRGALHFAQYDHGLLLVATPRRGANGALAECVRALEDSLAETARDDRRLLDVTVGIGDPRPSLEQARHTYEEARQAADVAARGAAGVGRIARWADLGVYRLLAQLAHDEPAPAAAHPGLARLLADPRATALVETLEVYLECAGSVHATAARLGLHRQSLYYRLRRIERLAGTDLHDGDERLLLHLGLKLARLDARRAPLPHR